ncbi:MULTISPECIES: hypothetical protein [Geobacillus]|nr:MULTISPECIES: hypothetical protein [Geobacillus]
MYETKESAAPKQISMGKYTIKILLKKAGTSIKVIAVDGGWK